MSLDFLMIKFHFLFNDIEITIQSKKLPMQSRLLTLTSCWDRAPDRGFVVEVLYFYIVATGCNLVNLHYYKLSCPLSEFKNK
jgi:hypothetical protein